MTALLNDNLPLIAGAPNGIKKLRALILELAVRGKLVPQDPTDESASELLNRIKEEKARLVADGSIRERGSLAPVVEEEWPFDLPERWGWVRLADLAYPQAGFAFKSQGFNDSGLGLPLIRIRDVGQSFSGTFYEGEYREEFLVEGGDYLVSMDGQFRVAPWQCGAALLNQRVSRLIFFGSEAVRRFIGDSLQARLVDLQGVKAYTTVDHLSGKQISAAVIGLPPLAEQHRIVAKVDELMVLCDRLEARQADADSAQAQLVQALLDSLVQASGAEDFAASWLRLVEHFHTLFNTESSIDALKQTLLQLAVMGKLVPQDPDDEPAGELLQRIAREKMRMTADGRLRKQKPAADLSEQMKPFDVPAGWEWASIVSLTLLVTDGTHHTPTYLSSGVPFISVKDINGSTVSFDECKYISEKEHLEINARCNPQKGDILLCRIGTLGRPTIVDTDVSFSLFVSVGLLKMPSESISRYLHCVLSSPLAYSQYQQIKAGGSHTNKLNLGDIPRLLIPVPPLAEQRRIILKLDQLMAICDELKSRVSAARQLHERLADALVEQAAA